MAKRKKNEQRKGDVSYSKEVVTDYTIYTDGGCAYNPGGPGGIGVVIINNASGEVFEICEGYCSTTNNRMEIMAVVKGLERIPKGKSALIFSDSQYVINVACGDWKMHTNLDLWKEFKKCSESHELSFRWVRGHTGNEMNERCDDLATVGINMEKKQEDSGYQSHNRKKETDSGIIANDILPNDLPKIFTGITDRQIKRECAQSIKRINEAKKTSFKDFMNLKTGGIDGWSRLKEEEARELFGDDIYNHFVSLFPSKKDYMNALKWYGRGLKADLIPRLIRTQLEITSNVISSRF